MTIEDIKKVFTEKVKGDTLISPHILDCMLFYEGFTLEVIDTIKYKFNKGIADVENIEQEKVNKANKENKNACIVLSSFGAEFPKANADLAKRVQAEASKLGCK